MPPIPLRGFNFNLERRIFGFVLSAIIFFIIYAISHDLIFGSSPSVLIADVSILIILLSLACLSYFVNLKVVIYILLIFLIFIITMFWFLIGGLHGPDTFNFIGLLVCTVALTNGKASYLLIGLIVMIQIVLVGLELFYPELFDINVPQSTLKAMPFHFLFASWITLAITLFLKRSYHQERIIIKRKNKELEEKSQEIHCQNEELQQQQESIQKINLTLEEKVAERTEDLLKKNQQIQAFTFLNAHKLRGSLARAKGLSYLLQNEYDPNQEQADLLVHLQNSLEELDQIIHHINDVLEKDIDDEA